MLLVYSCISVAPLPAAPCNTHLKVITMKKGLTKKKIVDESIRMIDEEGTANFSLHKLAHRLGIRPASLYNHIDSQKDLMTQISIEVIQMLIRAEDDAISGKTGDDAIRSLSDAYLHFGLEHYALYHIFMQTRHPHDALLEEKGTHVMDPILKSFSEINLSDEDKIHWERILRSILHGFVTQKHAGFFTYKNISGDKSFQMAIDCFISGIHQAAEKSDSSVPSASPERHGHSH